MNFISNLYFFWGWGVIMLLPCIVILGIGLDGVFKGEEVGASIGLIGIVVLWLMLTILLWRSTYTYLHVDKSGVTEK